MVYNVNKVEKKLIAKDIKDKMGAKLGIPMFIYKVLFFLIVVLAVGEVIFLYISSLEETEDRWIILLVTIAVVSCSVLFLSIIPLGIRSHVLRKYMMPWVGMKDEEILLDDNRIVYKFMNIFWQGYQEKFWWTFEIKYNQIVRIEYDEFQQMLRVYGPESSKKWSDRGLRTCISSVKADPEQEVIDCLEIPAYFDRFEELKSKLEEKTGQKVINNSRIFTTYR